VLSVCKLYVRTSLALCIADASFLRRLERQRSQLRDAHIVDTVEARIDTITYLVSNITLFYLLFRIF
jgi:hypothetical protein